jgi:hypothetical protein
VLGLKQIHFNSSGVCSTIGTFLSILVLLLCTEAQILGSRTLLHLPFD